MRSTGRVVADQVEGHGADPPGLLGDVVDRDQGAERVAAHEREQLGLLEVDHLHRGGRVQVRVRRRASASPTSAEQMRRATVPGSARRPARSQSIAGRCSQRLSAARAGSSR